MRHLLVVGELFLDAGVAARRIGAATTRPPSRRRRAPGSIAEDLQVVALVGALLAGGDDVGGQVLPQPLRQGATEARLRLAPRRHRLPARVDMLRRKPLS